MRAKNTNRSNFYRRSRVCCIKKELFWCTTTVVVVATTGARTPCARGSRRRAGVVSVHRAHMHHARYAARAGWEQKRSRFALGVSLSNESQVRGTSSTWIPADQTAKSFGGNKGQGVRIGRYCLSHEDRKINSNGQPEQQRTLLILQIRMLRNAIILLMGEYEMPRESKLHAWYRRCALQYEDVDRTHTTSIPQMASSQNKVNL